MARGLRSASTVTEREERTHQLFTQLSTTTDELARQELVAEIAETNLPLSTALARRYARSSSDLEDLIQVARVGLAVAIERFQPGEGTTFAAFAVPTITGELKRHFRDHCWAVRPPRSIQELRPRVEKVREELTQRLHRDPVSTDLAGHLGTSRELVDACLAADTSYRPVSLDAPVHQDSWTSLGDALAGDEGVEWVIDLIDLRAALATLSARQRRILSWRFEDELSQSQIAHRLGVSQMQVSRLLRETLGSLRRLLSTEETHHAA